MSTPRLAQFLQLLSRVTALEGGEGILASEILAADAGGFTAETTVEGQLQELYQHLKSVQVPIELGLGSFILATGAPLAIFADGASAVPGLELNNSKAMGIRWNDNATHNQVLTQFGVPADLDPTANVSFKALVSKSGATLADAATLDVAVFNQVVAALADADVDYGGTTSAITGDATAKTVQLVSLTLALANLPAAGSNVSLLVKPTNGVLTADDLTIHRAWLEYKRKALTS